MGYGYYGRDRGRPLSYARFPMPSETEPGQMADGAVGVILACAWLHCASVHATTMSRTDWRCEGANGQNQRLIAGVDRPQTSDGQIRGRGGLWCVTEGLEPAVGSGPKKCPPPLRAHRGVGRVGSGAATPSVSGRAPSLHGGAAETRERGRQRKAVDLRLRPPCTEGTTKMRPQA